MLQIQYATNRITTTDQTVHVYARWNHILNFQALNKPKMGTPLCDVTMTLKREEKIGKIFFLKQDAFVYKKCMFDTFTQKCPRDYTVAYTIW